LAMANQTKVLNHSLLLALVFHNMAMGPSVQKCSSKYQVIQVGTSMNQLLP